MQDLRVRHDQWFPVCFGLVLLLFLIQCTVCAAREKKDVIQFANGDRITCEIVKLEKGYLYVKLEYADGTVAMDWSKITGVESSQKFVVADKAGERHTGSLQSAVDQKAPQKPQVEVIGPLTSQVISGKEVVEIHRTDNTFWQNLHGGVDAGFNFTKQQSRTQYSFQSNAAFERAKWLTSANYESSFSGGGGSSDLRHPTRQHH